MKVKLQRTNLRPLIIHGESIANVDNKVEPSGNQANRWTRLTVYLTDDKTQYILHHCYFTIWQGEKDCYVVKTFAKLDGLMAYVEAEVPQLATELAEKLQVAENLVSPEAEARRKAIVALARQHHALDGELEFDDDAKLSEPDSAFADEDNNGCYVQAWVWVDFTGTPFDKQAVKTA